MPSILSLTLLLATFLSFVAGSTAKADNKPAVILVPGAFHKAAVYYKVTALLAKAGYTTDAIDLPSVGARALQVSRSDDIAVVKSAIDARLRQHRDVILVGNSYGATVISEAVKDLEHLSSVHGGPAHRPKVLGLIMLSGFIPYITELQGARPDIRKISPSWFAFDQTKLVYWNGDLTHDPPSFTFYNMLGMDEANKWSRELQPSSFAALNATAQYIPYTGKFRCLYVIGKNDNSVPPALAQSYITQPGAKFESFMIDSDHISPLSHPNEVTKIIRYFAGEPV